ncbi:MAG: cell division ATP-binding protein FtsE [Deltaproteobacteria bacterium]|jgi:cell division transport system ATP-binding protein|nr:cell division ATP-binding protein FtsE [Deltaproteobacteria bacterium]
MVRLFRVSKIYPPNYPALVDVHLQIDKGEFVFLSGPSGAGKTTLLKLLFRQEEATEGQIIVNGRNITRLNGAGVAGLRQELGLVFQEFRLLPSLTALENVALAAEVVGTPRRESRRKAFNLLRELGLKDKHDCKPPALSGGEQQRVAIARALVNDPILVLADEPTGNLDAEMAEETMRLLLRIHERGTTVLIATHDTGLLERFSYRVVYLQRGRLMGDSKQPCEEGSV